MIGAPSHAEAWAGCSPVHQTAPEGLRIAVVTHVECTEEGSICVTMTLKDTNTTWEGFNSYADTAV